MVHLAVVVDNNHKCHKWLAEICNMFHKVLLITLEYITCWVCKEQKEAAKIQTNEKAQPNNIIFNKKFAKG